MTTAGPATIPAASIALSPSVRDETTVQAALEAGVQQVITEQGFLATTSAPPGDIYATDTRSYDPGTYIINGATKVSSTNNVTDVQVQYELDGFLIPFPWVDNPRGGTLTSADISQFPLSGGLHTIVVRLSRVAGSGDAEAVSSTAIVTKIGPLP